MPGGDGTQVRLDDFGGTRHADLAYVPTQCRLLRQACAQNQQTAVLAQQEAARIRADARRSRGELVRARLPGDVSSGAVARRLVEAHLGAASADELVDVQTVVSELVNNAFLHGKGAIELRISNRRGRGRIEVIDEGQGTAAQVKQRDGHRGLDIVGALSLAWGTNEGSTHVWAELPATGRAADPARRRLENRIAEP